MRVGLGLKDRNATCAGCHHKVSEHVVTMSTGSLMAKCGLCSCNGRLSVEA